MSQRFHINPETGNVNICKAVYSCRFGDPILEHFDSREKARSAAEDKLAAEHMDPALEVKGFRKRYITDEEVSFNGFDYALELIEKWPKPWTRYERENLQKIMKLEKLLASGPLTEAMELELKRFPEQELWPVMSPRSNSYNGKPDNPNMARDKALKSLAELVIMKKQADSYEAPPVKPRERNKRIIGLEAAQENAFAIVNRPGYSWDNKPQVGPTAERYLHEAIDRTVAGQPSAPFLQEDTSYRHLLKESDRVHLAMTATGSGDTQALYLATAFPDKELKEEMERAGVDGVAIAPLLNGRETGHIYTVISPSGDTRSFAVYEHRNSDSIIINGKTNWDGKERPYVADSSNAFFSEIAQGDYRRTAQTLTYFLKQAQTGELEDDAYLAANAARLDWHAILSEKLPGFGEWAEKSGYGKARGATDEDILAGLDFTSSASQE